MIAWALYPCLDKHNLVTLKQQEADTNFEIDQYSKCDLPHQHGQQEDDEHPQQAPGVGDGPTASQESHHRAEQSKSKSHT